MHASTVCTLRYPISNHKDCIFMASTSFPLPLPPTGRRSSPGRRLPASCVAQTASCYEVLGLRAGATCQEIKTAYRRKARVMHPDVRGDDDEFIALQVAYATLSDPARRAVYDRSLFGLPRATAAGGFTELARRRRTWETDQCW